MVEGAVPARNREEHSESRQPIMGPKRIFILDVYLVASELTGVAFPKFDGAEVRSAY